MTREEAIKIVQSATVWTDEERDALAMLIPELSESEDERIRRTLVEYFGPEVQLDFIRGVPIKKIRDWLEKQKEASKAIEAVERIDKYIDEHLANAHDMKDSNPDKKYYRGWDDALGKMAGILQDVYSGEKQKEQKPKNELEDAFKYYTDRGISISCGDIKAEPKEQKPAEWSKNDTVFLNEITDFFENKTVRLQHDIDMYAHWLKSLPKRFNLQPKQEWSEEDEEMIKRILADLRWERRNTTFDKDIRQYDEEITWLEALRPQYHGDVAMTEAYKMGKEAGEASCWKPSEEQMKALDKAIPVCMGVVGRDEIVPLESLYEQLKKL